MSVPTEKPRLPRPTSRTNAPVIDLAKRTSTPRTTSGFAAQIEGASIADLIQLECTRGLTRAVRVSAGEQTGYLYFDQGEVVHAVAGVLKGEDAALEILTWEGGTVRPSDSYWVNPPTIRVSWQALLISAAQAADEAARPDSEVISRKTLEKAPRARPSRKEEPVKPNPQEGVTRMVVTDAAGQLIRTEGDTSDFADAAAYCVQLAQLIGEELGLEPFQGIESSGSSTTMIAYVDGPNTVALEAPAGVALDAHRKKAGL